MFNQKTVIGYRPARAGWLVLMAAMAPLGARADVIALFDEVAAGTITPPVAYPAVTPSELRTLFQADTATVHVAMYDAVVAIKGVYEPFASVPTAPVAGASVNAAAATAACEVLRGLFPNRAPQYEPACQSYMAALPETDARTRGIAVGAEIAAATLAFRSDDGRMTNVAYVPGSEPGDFRGVNPIIPFYRFLRPFALESASQFRAEGPPDLTSFAYAKDLNEVKALGGAVSQKRTDAQTDIARFHTEPPPFFLSRNLRRFASDDRRVVDNARLMAMMWVVQSDALQGCFDSKYHFDFWRPQSAIPLADTDGNAATLADPAWTPVVPTPNHPEYPAAHACSAGALASVLDEVFGVNKIAFDFDSRVPGLAKPVHHYKNASAMVRELRLARIYGGMHYRNSTIDGAALGTRTGNWIVRRYFRRVGD